MFNAAAPDRRFTRADRLSARTPARRRLPAAINPVI
jgi:hypothetical protein